MHLIPWLDSIQRLVGLAFLALFAANQQPSVLRPGDSRLDGSRIRPYTIHYGLFEVDQGLDSTEEVTRVASITDRVQLIRVPHDSVILRIREEFWSAGDTSFDTLVLNRRTLAPIMDRQTSWNKGGGVNPVHEGFDFRGDTVAFLGQSPDFSLDTTLKDGPAFFYESVPLILQALRDTTLLSTTLPIYMVDHNEHIYTYILARVDTISGLRSTDSLKLPNSRNRWILTTPIGTIWVDKKSLHVVRLEHQTEDADFLWRLVQE